MRRMTIAVVAAHLLIITGNTALMFQNSAQLRRILELRHMNEEIAATYRKLAAGLPEHSCGTTILPGERCTMSAIVPFKFQTDPDPDL